MATRRRSNSLPVNDAFIKDHVTGGSSGSDLPRIVLPKTIVPDYLDETPLQEQPRHDESFHQTNPGTGSTKKFYRPTLADNLKLIDRNLSDTYYFEMRYRYPYPEALYPGVITGIEVESPDGNTIIVGETLELNVTVTGIHSFSSEVTWTSADETIATVTDTGTVTGISAGTTHIVATSVDDETFSDSAELTVNEEPDVGEDPGGEDDPEH